MKRKKRMKKQSVTVRLSTDLLERMRNLVYWTPGSTMNSLVEESLEESIKKLEEKKGDAFPQRTKPLQPGRKVTL
jgi:predicted DNA-binding protein